MSAPEPTRALAYEDVYIATTAPDFIRGAKMFSRAAQDASNGKICNDKSLWCSVDLPQSAIFLRKSQGGAMFSISVAMQDSKKSTEANCLKDMIAIIDILGRTAHRFPPDWDLEKMKADIARKQAFDYDLDPDIVAVDDKRRIFFNVDDKEKSVFFSFSMKTRAR